MELPNDVDVQLAAALAYYLRNSGNSQFVTASEKAQQQLARNNSTARTATFNSARVKRCKTQIGQNRQISSQPVHLNPDNVDSRAVSSQLCSRNKENRTGVPITEVGIPTKIAEWKNKLDRLSFLFSSFSDGTMSATQMCTELDGEFHDLITFLCHTSSIGRPVAVSDPVEVYAGSLVKLHQYCIISSDNLVEGFPLIDATLNTFWLPRYQDYYAKIVEVQHTSDSLFFRQPKKF
ncbi:unnamed protein product [Litomosoides sigmodontis]|uniref:Uncharacterized protein n=1 Tax=Litomosoides sigmodontis TaxID=42156 RepID=A0A3P6SZZ2_LITSI|nr:unnamed protein product [Litomosoides sigmodontis]